MKIKELLMAIHRNDFNMVKELEVKTYLPIEEKKLIAKGIMYECTEQVNGVTKVDSVQRYLSYVKYMLTHHTNLEYTQDDYDVLCSTEYEGSNLLNAIMECFGADAKECSRILNLMMDDKLQETAIEFTLAKFLSDTTETINSLAEGLQQKIDSFDLNSMIPKDVDANKLVTFLNTYMK